MLVNTLKVKLFTADQPFKNKPKKIHINSAHLFKKIENMLCQLGLLLHTLLDDGSFKLFCPSTFALDRISKASLKILK